MGTTKEKTGQGEEEEESNHLESRTGHDGGGGDWSVRCGHPFKQHLGGGSTCSHSSLSTRAEPNILKNSWRLGSDQDGGSGGHLLGQRWMQVREKATGDLLVFIFVKIPLQLSLFFVKVKVF